MLELNTIHCGDCQTVMCDIDSDSVDCIITDPPYGLSFMGKDWDKAVPSVEIWRECLRALKPGAFAFVMCIPRQDCLARMICRLEDAGFNVAFSSIYHTFASGFPKAQNLSKVADKRVGVKREVIAIDKTAAARANKNKFNQCTAITPGNLGVNTREFCSHTGEITEAVTQQAKALDGAYSGCQLKPAVEVVIVVTKPLSEKTYVEQALSNMHGCTWLDDCRIPYPSEGDKNFREKDVAYRMEKDIPATKSNINNGVGAFVNANNKGRFPANVICEDNVLDDGKVIKPPIRPNIEGKAYPASQSINFYGKKTTFHGYPDKGSFSRYFSLDSWFSERIKLLPKEAQKTFPWLIVPKASKSEKNKGLEDSERKQVNDGRNKLSDNAFQRGATYRINTHSTVKPIKLMLWLITLASREGDIVLDPFCGSGTTAIAAKMLGRQYIGIEREEDYCEIARKRASAVPTRLDGY